MTLPRTGLLVRYEQGELKQKALARQMECCGLTELHDKHPVIFLTIGKSI